MDANIQNTIPARVYYRDDAGLVKTRGAQDMTERDVIESLTSDPEFGFRSIGTESLMGWPDLKVEWFTDVEHGMEAIGFPR